LLIAVVRGRTRTVPQSLRAGKQVSEEERSNRKQKGTLMKTLLLATLLISSFGSTLIAGQSKPTSPTSSIREVTVYSDRARVTREAKVKLSTTAADYAFEHLPGWIDEESIRAAITPVNAGSIIDVQVKKQFLAQSSDETIRKAKAAVSEMSDKIGALNDELKILGEQRKQIEATRVFSMSKLPKDAAIRKIDMEDYKRVVDFITSSLREIAASRRDVNKKLRELQPELNAQQRNLNELNSLTQLEEVRILVTVVGAREKNAILSLTYMLPGATWEPAHELRAKGARPQNVLISSSAIVTQTTGEDWSSADIYFSTQSPTETIKIPEMDALLIGNGRAAAKLMGGHNASFQKAQQAYQGQQFLWNNYVNPNKLTQADFASNWRGQTVNSTRVTTLFKRLQTRGTTAHFAGTTKPTVRSDGQAISIPIGKVELKAKSHIVAAPQVSLNATHTVEMTNSGEQPILPGRVSLYHNEAFLGMTDVDFVAEGESFSIFLGVDDKIKLSRVLDKKNSSIVRGKRTRMQVSFEITVENLSSEVYSISLADRIPISQRKEIEIDRVKITPEITPDSKGLLRWDVSLKAKEVQTFRIEYRIEYPPAVIQQMKEARSNSEAMSADDDMELSIDIENLEAAF
jgi:uncharacterized protein (TIGR02231 family)